MTLAQTGEPISRKPLRLWPGVVLVTLQWLTLRGLPLVLPDALEYSIFGAIALGGAIVLWWLFFSRAAWVERVGAILLMVAGVAIAYRIADKSIRTGMMGMMLPILSIPVLCLALVLWAVATRRLSDRVRRITMVATIVVACGAWTLIRTNGMTTDASSDLAWRWAPTAEDRLLAHAEEKPVAIPAVLKEPEPVPTATASVKAPVAARVEPVHTPAPVTEAASTADWPGFRGAHRNGVATGLRIDTDWSASPPVQMWKRPIGPGWSSFAVHGDRLYTQEQRGSDEVVACYQVSTGEPLWKHADVARFWESNAGAGPRGTPTFNNGRLYTFGATGIVNALDARTGAVIWTRNAGSDTGTKTPEWGFASSPLVADDIVVVAASGRLIGYDLATGNPRWTGPEARGSYSSPHPVTIDGVSQILLLNGPGVTSVSPADGKKLWDFALPPGVRIVQPGLTADGSVLASEEVGNGLRRIAVTHGPGGWTAEERWRTIALKPYSSDFVVQNGLAFGFDGSLISCIDLNDGKRKWKGGRYGSGQMILLADQDVLLVVSEEGDLALVAASGDGFKELARVKGIEGKTWNHPALAGDVLLVRNGEEMAAFRLKMARR